METPLSALSKATSKVSYAVILATGAARRSPADGTPRAVSASWYSARGDALARRRLSSRVRRGVRTAKVE